MDIKSHICYYLQPILPNKFNLELYLAPLSLSRYSYHSCKCHVLKNTAQPQMKILEKINDYYIISTVWSKANSYDKSSIDDKLDIMLNNSDSIFPRELEKEEILTKTPAK